MKTELKTLKDIEHNKIMIDETIRNGKVIDHELFISQKLLKQEAIKWVKFYSKDLEDENAQFIRMWIWKFFNLTEEDLK
jgi:hypothetical protein